MTTLTAVAAGGNWGTAGTWSPAQIPTAADDCVIDGTCTATVTIDGTSGTPSLCRSLNCTGFANTLSHAASKVLTIGDGSGGALTLVAGMTYAPSNTSTLNFVSTTGTNVITTAGKAMGPLVFNGAAGSWQFADGYTSSTNGAITLTQGTLDLNGKTISITTFTSSGALTRVLTMGGAQLNTNTGSTAINFSGSGMTLNANTSTITLGGGPCTFAGNGLTFNNLVCSFGDSITGANTFNNLTIAAGASCTFSADQTCTTLTMNGTAASRAKIKSNTIGTQRTFTVGTVTCTGASFADINAAGAGNWDLHAITGFAEDLGNNTGITFTSPQTNYYQSAITANYNDATKWFLATNGGGGAGRIPLAQDTGIFDNNSVTAAGKTITMNSQGFGNLQCTGLTNSPTLTFSSSVSCYGDMTVDTSFTMAGTGTMTYAKRGTQTLTSNTVAFLGPIAVNSFNGTLTNADTTSCTTLTISSGTMSLGANVTLTGALSVTGTLSGASNNVSGGTTYGDTATGVTTLNLFSGTSISNIQGTATFTTLTLSSSFALSANSGNVTIGSGGMTCTTFNINTAGGSNTFTSGSGQIVCSSTCAVGGNATNNITIGNGGLKATTITMSAGASVPTIKMGNGTWECTGTGTVFTGAAVTLDKGLSTILISDTSATTKTVALSTKRYWNLTVSGAAANGTVTFTGAAFIDGTCTFNPDCSIIFTAGTTLTIGTLNWFGTSGHVITIVSSSAGSAATISSKSGVSCDWLSLKDNTASGGTPFYAGANSTLVSGDTNWLAQAPAFEIAWWPDYDSDVNPNPLRHRYSANIDAPYPFIAPAVTVNAWYPDYDADVNPAPKRDGWNQIVIPTLPNAIAQIDFFPIYDAQVKAWLKAAQYSTTVANKILPSPIAQNNWYPDYDPDVTPVPPRAQFSNIFAPMPVLFYTPWSWKPCYDEQVKPAPKRAHFSSMIDKVLPGAITMLNFFPRYDAEVKPWLKRAHFSTLVNKILPTPIPQNDWYPTYRAEVFPNPPRIKFSTTASILEGIRNAVMLDESGGANTFTNITGGTDTFTDISAASNTYTDQSAGTNTYTDETGSTGNFVDQIIPVTYTPTII